MDYAHETVSPDLPGAEEVLEKPARLLPGLLAQRDGAVVPHPAFAVLEVPEERVRRRQRDGHRHVPDGGHEFRGCFRDGLGELGLLSFRRALHLGELQARRLAFSRRVRHA